MNSVTIFICAWVWVIHLGRGQLSKRMRCRAIRSHVKGHTGTLSLRCFYGFRRGRTWGTGRHRVLVLSWSVSIDSGWCSATCLGPMVNYGCKRRVCVSRWLCERDGHQEPEVWYESDGCLLCSKQFPQYFNLVSSPHSHDWSVKELAPIFDVCLRQGLT